MKKLKKPSNKKPFMVFIYGPIAVGKLTVAKILSKKLGCKMIHNHQINDFVREVFDRGTYGSAEMKDFLRYYVLEMVAKHKLNTVITHAYAHNFVSKTGLSDPKYVKTLEKKITKLGVSFYPVQLTAHKDTLLKRVSMSSRRDFDKLTDKKIMREILQRDDHISSPNLKNNFVINNTKLSPQKVADIITNHFKLK